MSAESFDAVIFDMDGVLTDSEPFIAAAGIAVLRERYGLELTRANFAAYVGGGDDRFVAGPAAARGVTVTLPDDKLRMYEIYLDLIRGALQPLPGAVAFVRELGAAGCRLALATAADRVKMAGNLREIGIPEGAFRAIVVGDEVVHKKPNPEVFLLAASRLGVDPARCLVVEDAPNGIRAAVAAGARCLGITSTFTAETLIAAGANDVAPNLASVPPGVRRALHLGG